MFYRGRGMIVGIEIVTDKESRKPAPEAADLLSHKYIFYDYFLVDRHGK